MSLVRRARVEDAGGIARVAVRAWQSAYRGIVPDDYLDHPARAFYARFGFVPDGPAGVDAGTGVDEIRLQVSL